MNLSNNGLSLIKKWEGCKLEAYLDSVKVPTIGYGTIAYPDGRAVKLGDQITQDQAEGYLQHECLSVCARVSQLVKVPLNQNQFDALISLAYNIGVGAFSDSTLLKKLNQSDFSGAAEQILVWNKGTINGQKVVIGGLVNRRQDENAFFTSTNPSGQPIIPSIPTPQQEVTWLEGYDEGDSTVIVAWNGASVVEIVSLPSQAKRLLIDVLNQYPRAANFVIAPAGKVIPAGDRITIAERNPARVQGVASSTPPPVPATILERGSEGHDVEILQDRLQDLGYYKDKIDGLFAQSTDAAVRRFQTDVFGAAEADGRVGRITWGKLWETSPAAPVTTAPGVPGKTYMRLSNTRKRDRDGLMILNLDYIKAGNLEGTIEVCSGGPGAQAFRTGVNSRAGSMEPLPEGRWMISDIVWCAGRDIYDGAIFASGLGPVSTPLAYDGPGTTERGNIEIHLDWNKNHGAPGTAGCIGINTIKDYKTLVRWLRDSDPRNLYVDWGLGTCPSP